MRLARERMEAAGLSGLAEVRVQDYDAIVSVEMIEAVGEAFGQWPRIHAQGFDETFRRMWEFYLAYSEAGFRSGYLGGSQLQMTREPA